MTGEEKKELLDVIFSPSAPVRDIKFFKGRHSQIEKIKEALSERGRHIIMYGGRGVGKTSLTNILPQILPNIIVRKINCNEDDNYRILWDKVFKSIRLVTENEKIGFGNNSESKVINLQLPQDVNIDADTVEEMLNYVSEKILIIFDEYDSIKSEKTKKKIAETIKLLSDNVPHVTIMITGIAKNVSELIGNHYSLERCLSQIELPKMPKEEAEKIIISGTNILKIKTENKIKDAIINYAAGFPHYVHLLTKYAAMFAVERDDQNIHGKDFDMAVNKSIEKSNHSIIDAYEKATKSKLKNRFKDLILVCSMIKGNEGFTAEQVVKKYNKIYDSNIKTENINYNLGMLCKPERGNILQKKGKKQQSIYFFRNPLMKTFIQLKNHKNN